MYASMKAVIADAYQRRYAMLTQQATLPVALSLDHSNAFDPIGQAFHAGFSRLMNDASTLPRAENIRQTGINLLTVSVGTARGLYPPNVTPQINFEHLAAQHGASPPPRCSST